MLPTVDLQHSIPINRAINLANIDDDLADIFVVRKVFVSLVVLLLLLFEINIDFNNTSLIFEPHIVCKTVIAIDPR